MSCTTGLLGTRHHCQSRSFGPVQGMFPPVNHEDVQGRRKHTGPGDPSEQNGCLYSFQTETFQTFSVKIVTKCLLILPNVFGKCCDPIVGTSPASFEGEVIFRG